MDANRDVNHRYNTRSRRNAGYSHDHQAHQSDSDPDPSPRRLSIRRLSSPSQASIDRNPHTSRRGWFGANRCFCGKYYKTSRIVAIIVVLIIFIWYTAGSSYAVIRREIDKLSSHIHNMDNILQKAADQKGFLDRQLDNIAATLPKIKKMATSLQGDVEKLQCPHACADDEGNTIREIIREELERFNSDKTGRTDYALENSGGQVVNTRNTVAFSTSGQGLALFGIPLCEGSNSPNALIQPGVMPGECWAFKGDVGSAVIKLIKPIAVTGVSLEHISRKISPSGEIKSAPKDFSIWGLTKPDETEGYFYGKYKYNINGNAVQYFPVQHQNSFKFGYAEFKVHSNHGNTEYTCVYRIRVHGDG